ncbi:hypothetical protein ABZ820_33825 [Streptomyces diacarni]|uniref:hypothetical protein n=1 Tax=Streptomyces diacarni TaxID=2800381 RepID=UPI0033C71992
MPDPTSALWDRDQVAAHLHIAPGSVRGALRRLGVQPVEHRQVPGGRVRAYYRAEEVRAAAAARPGQGARTDLRNT